MTISPDNKIQQGSKILAETARGIKNQYEIDFKLEIVRDAVDLLRENAVDETSYEVEIAGMLETYILKPMEMDY